MFCFAPWGYVRKVYATYIYGEGLLYKAGLQITNPIIHTGLFTYLQSGKGLQAEATVNVIFMCFSLSPGAQPYGKSYLSLGFYFFLLFCSSLYCDNKSGIIVA